MREVCLFACEEKHDEAIQSCLATLLPVQLLRAELDCFVSPWLEERAMGLLAMTAMTNFPTTRLPHLNTPTKKGPRERAFELMLSATDY